MKTIATSLVLTLFLCDHLFSQPNNDPIGISGWLIPEKNGLSESYLKVHASIPLCPKEIIPVIVKEPLCNFKTKSGSKPKTEKKTTFLVQPYYEYRILKSGGSNGNTLHLHGIGIPFIYTNYTEDLRYEYVLVGFVRDNFTKFNLNTNALQFGGAVINKFRLNNKLRVYAGLYVNQEFFRDFFMPILGFEWKACNHLNIFMDFPVGGKAEYILGRKFLSGLAIKTITNSYRIDDGDINYIRIEDIHVTAYINYYLCQQIVASIESGLTIGRELTSNNPEIFPEEEENGLIMKAGIYYRLPNRVW